MAKFEESRYENQVFEAFVWDGFLEDIEFYRCVFKNCSFQSSRLEECRFESCEFVQSNLSLVEMRHTAFVDVLFSGCKIRGVNWGAVGGIFSASFDNCMLDNDVFSDMSLIKMRFSSCSLAEALFSNVNLMRSVFDDCDLHLCQFHQANLSFADFTTSRNYYMNAETNILRKTRFTLPEAVSLLGNLDIVLK